MKRLGAFIILVLFATGACGQVVQASAGQYLTEVGDCNNGGVGWCRVYDFTDGNFRCYVAVDGHSSAITCLKIEP